MSRTYIAQHLVSGAQPADRLLAINNPVDSGVSIAVRCIESKLVLTVQEAMLLIERYPDPVTGGTAASFEPGDDESTPTYPRLLRRSGSDPAPQAEPFGGAFSLPVAARTYDEVIALQSRSGEASCFEFDEGPLIVAPGESVVATLLEADSYDSIRIAVEFDEVPVEPVAYLSSALPGVGAWLAGGWFALPDDWDEVVLHLVYTAANPAVLPRPKIRARWRAGGTVEAQQPIAGTVDTTAPPVARRLQQLLEETVDATSAGSVVTHAFVYSRMPGFDEVAFDVAEFGATATPGSIVALITGR